MCMCRPYIYIIHYGQDEIRTHKMINIRRLAIDYTSPIAACPVSVLFYYSSLYTSYSKKLVVYPHNYPPPYSHSYPHTITTPTP